MKIQKLMTMSDYGTIEVRLKSQMDRQGVTRNALAKAVGTEFSAIDRWYQGSVERMDLDLLARVCCVLCCNVSDILHYKP